VESISFNSYIFPLYSLNLGFKEGFRDQKSARVTKNQKREANSRKENLYFMKYVHELILLWIYIASGVYYLSICCYKRRKA